MRGVQYEEFRDTNRSSTITGSEYVIDGGNIPTI
jgi:hypothetical protein